MTRRAPSPPHPFLTFDGGRGGTGMYEISNVWTLACVFVGCHWSCGKRGLLAPTTITPGMHAYLLKYTYLYIYVCIYIHDSVVRYHLFGCSIGRVFLRHAGLLAAVSIYGNPCTTQDHQIHLSSLIASSAAYRGRKTVKGRPTQILLVLSRCL